MEDRARDAAAREFRVNPASIDQIQALGIDDQTTLALLGLRSEAQLELSLGPGITNVKPSVGEITTTYVVFGGGEQGLASVSSVTARYPRDLRS